MIRGVLDKVFGYKANRLIRQGNEHYMHGDEDKALSCARKAIDEYERASGAYTLLAQVLMPGDDYLTVLGKVHETFSPKSYVEVGVDRGRSMKLINKNTSAVGIDPDHHIETGNETHAKIFTMYSDDFFKEYDLLKELGTSRIDMAFVDGSHIFEQTLRDIINIEKYSDNRTLMILHDCIPAGRIVAERKRTTGFWCGDVWKLVDCLKKYRPDLMINVVAARPSGLVFITGLDSGSTILQEKYDDIEKEYISKELGYSSITSDILTDCLPSQWENIVECLPN